MSNYKKVTIQTPLAHFEDAWGDTYHTGEEQPFPEEVTLKDGQEWGHTREQVEAKIKEKVASVEAGKFGAALVSTDPQTLMVTIRYFASEEDRSKWEADPTTYADLVLDTSEFQGSMAPEGYTMAVNVTRSLSQTQVAGAENNFVFTYNSYWGGDTTDLDTQPGTAVLTVNGEVKQRLSLASGGNQYAINAGQYCTQASNRVAITISNTHDKSRTWNFIVEALTLDLTLEPSYINQQSVAKGSNWELPIRVSGVGGTVYVKVDNGTPQSREVAGNTSATFYIDQNDLLADGTHTIEMWCSNSTYGLATDHLFAQFIKAGEDAAVAIGTGAPDEVTIYGTGNIPYFFYAPSADEGDEITVMLTLKDENAATISATTQKVTVDANHSSGMQEAIIHLMDNAYIGQTVTLTIAAAGATGTHSVDMVSAGVIIQEATECKVHYDLGSKSNADSDVVANAMESYYNGQRTSRLVRSDNFKLNSRYGFHNGGMVIGAGKTLTLLDWQPFSTDVGANGTQTGITIEMEMGVGVCADTDVPVVSCMDAKCGFEVFPNRVEVKHAGSNDRVITYFPDEERVKFSLVINGTTTHCVNDDGNGNIEISDRNLAFIYMNGVIVRIFEYGSATWNQNTVKNIVFGSLESEVMPYSFRGYDKALSMKEIIDNYAYDTPDVDDKIAIAKRNNILQNDGQTIDINKIAAALPNTPVITWWAERLPANKKDPQTCTQTEFVNPEWEEALGHACAPFTAGEHEINGDGTSSNAYPLPYKNWAEKFNGFTLHLTSGDITTSKYSITYGIDDKEKKFVHKVNYASSEGIFNILAMNMYQQLTLATKGQISDLLSAQQKEQDDNSDDITFRKSLSGFPEIGFRKHTVNGQLVTDFLSIYNFINNKKTGSMFGMVDDYTVNQLWEVDENRNFFLEYMTEHTVVGGQVVESNGVRDSEPLYYARFPADSPVNTGNDLGICTQVSEVQQANDEIRALRDIHNWVYSINPNVAKRYYARYGEYRAFTIAEDGFTEKTYAGVTYTTDTPQYRAQKFLDEYGDHLHANDCIFYFLFCTYIIGKDSMDKNMSLFLDTVEDFYSEDADTRAAAKVKLRIMLRDTDTTNMFDNTGVLMYKYWHEWNDTYNATTGETGQITGETWDGTKYVINSSVAGASPVFNGRLSGLWDAISEFLPTQIRTVYLAMRSGGMNYNGMFQMYQHFRDYWCEALYNTDGMGYANTGNLNMAYGDKLLLSKYFYKMRERYMDSKYGYADPSKRVTMRLSEVPGGVWMKHYTPVYASFSYGSGTPVTARSIVVGTAALLPCGSQSLEDAVCYVNDADMVTEFGFYKTINGVTILAGLEGIQDFHFTLNFNRFKRLTKFIWNNTSLKPNTEQTTQNGSIDFSGMTMLRELVMTYCTGWNGQPIIGSEIIEKIDFRGTPITQITIPETETLTELYLPNTLTELSLIGLTNLEVFTIAGVANLMEINVANTPLVAETVTNALLTLIDNGGTPVLQSGHLVLDSMDNETFNKLVIAFGIEAFNADNPLYIECPDGAYIRVNKSVIEGGDTVMLQSVVKPADVSTVVEYQMIENGEVVTPVEGIATSSGGTTLDTATGELTTVENIAETLSFQVAATIDGTTVYSDEIELEIHVYTYPTTLNINGDFELRADGDNIYTKSYSPASFTATIKSVIWSLSGGDGKCLIANQSASSATIRAMGVDSTESVAMLTCTVTFTMGKTLSGSKSITLQTMELRAVDLGLPSGIKWANFNIGATAPEQYGLSFQWGDTVGYPTAAAMNEALGRTDGFTQAAYNAQGLNAISASLSLSQDAAHEHLGGNWRMPTSANFVELNNNCTSVWTTYRGVAGCLFTSKINGRSIFFPAAGHWNGTSLYSRGTVGYYWSSTFNYASYAYYLNFNSGFVNPQNFNNRWIGFTVRAVQ